MAVCLICGKECGDYLCDECRESVDIEKLCQKVLDYHIGSGENPLWDRIAAEMLRTGYFRSVLFSLAEPLVSPRKEYWKTLSFSGNGSNVSKNDRPWLYDAYAKIKDNNGLTRFEINRIKGLVLGALFMDYRYEEAEQLADEMIEEETLPVQSYYNLADFYCKTRRYDEAEEAIMSARRLYGTDADMLKSIVESIEKYREKEAAGKQQYMPNPKENKEEIKKRYVEFLASLGINAETHVISEKRKKGSTAIPEDQYPKPKVIRNADFDTFVAYDLETTGLKPQYDAIIEIGAVKVCGGKVLETREFTFQEFVRPYKKTISPEITAITGITKEDVKDARQMWDVFSDFMEFSKGCVLVGYNNAKFDSRFLVRAGRHAHIIMENPQFDVMWYADKLSAKIGLTGKMFSLGTLCSKLDIKNPRAHRALADAITTARVFLKLKEIDNCQ